MSQSESPLIAFPDTCPCCGYVTLDGRGEYDICRICWWEDDGQDNDDANVVRGGPNGKLSLTRARINFITDGIFSPCRTDLRDKQESIQTHQKRRHFIYDTSAESIDEPALNWSTSTIELDDDQNASRYNIGDSVVYRRRDLDTANRIGTVKTVEWNVNIEIWHYRLLDDLGKPIEKWFDGSRLRPNNVG